MVMPAAPQNHTDQAIMVGTNVMGRIMTTESPTLNGSGIYLNQLFSSQGNAFSLTHAYRGLSLQAGRTRVATRCSARGATCICHLGTEYALMVPGDTSTHFGGVSNNHKRPSLRSFTDSNIGCPCMSGRVSMVVYSQTVQ